MLDTKKDPMLVKLGERIKLLREEKGISQADLVVALDGDVSRSLINTWESGDRMIKVDMLYRVAQYFGTSTDFLLGLTDVKSTDATLKSASDYTGFSEEAIRNITENHKVLEPFFASDHFEEFCNKMHRVNSDIGSLARTLKEADDKLDRISTIEEYADQSYEINCLQSLLYEELRFGKLAKFEALDAVESLLMEVTGLKEMIEKAEILYEDMNGLDEASEEL